MIWYMSVFAQSSGLPLRIAEQRKWEKSALEPPRPHILTVFQRNQGGRCLWGLAHSEGESMRSVARSFWCNQAWEKKIALRASRPVSRAILSLLLRLKVKFGFRVCVGKITSAYFNGRLFAECWKRNLGDLSVGQRVGWILRQARMNWLWLWPSRQGWRSHKPWIRGLWWNSGQLEN